MVWVGEEGGGGQMFSAQPPAAIFCLAPYLGDMERIMTLMSAVFGLAGSCCSGGKSTRRKAQDSLSVGACGRGAV